MISDPVSDVRLDIPVTLREVKVPTLVILGWAACVTTRAKLAAATFPTSDDDVKFVRKRPSPVKYPLTVVPVTDSAESVPTDVIFGCEPPDTTTAYGAAPTRLEAGIFESADAFPVNKPPDKLPETVRLERVPTLVMLGWDACVTTRAKLAAATFPTRLLEFMFEIAEPLAEMKPATVRLSRIPSDVTRG